ncbi:long-chain fatty acid transport protein 4 [Frankliniella occidentalis]|uniref:Very long-chain fatty acid transport protein n=1 Tax=Frankliniella occidentalis TaxID=133901 RepID=A0A6J1TTV5_FRAOC|nr:long-chain fatty acid transport protein 4 [Frankliniella occidentalis]XP_026294060.1 long-chain fatty acid transport protein 4 [Frankliniella occidentalis]XP_026294061.1 long-chain fatty acid transport protein 4 [Frankliniella occidentalis]
MATVKRLAIGLAGSLAASLWLGQSPLLLPLLATLAALAPAAPQLLRRVWAVLRTLPRDMHFLFRAIKTYKEIKRIERKNACLADIFDEQVLARPDKVLIKHNGKEWTFRQVSDYSKRVANAFQRRGYVKGDVVAVFMNNCPEYVALWLGLSRLGVVAALINHNQRSKALVHSLTIAKSRAVVFGAELADAALEVKDQLGETELFQLHVAEEVAAALPPSVEDLRAILDASPVSDPTAPRPGYKDALLYIYTSGTTGLPKAAKIVHSRYIAAGKGIPMLTGMVPEDVVYAPLPLYHSAGGMCAMGYGLAFGMTVVLRTKFSASAFIPDCVQHECTVVQYIGEVCRYVLTTPVKDSDTQHRIRLMIGNGMRPAVWQRFVDRFRVPHVVELYGSTEGNVTFFNFDNTVGAVGFLPRFLPEFIYPIGFVRVDQDSGDIIRGQDGLCQRCDINEPGMLVGYISDSDPSREFHGYLDKSSSEKKILRDVYVKGDKWFMTGDILVMDELGYIYFRDRTGDTFRWKGENVSTAEVEAVVSAAVGERDIAAYGVEVAGSEGRAGMVAIADPNGTLDLDKLAKEVDRHLPSYARPLFIRTVPRIEKTGTYKIVKVNLQKQGYDPAAVSDPLFVRQRDGYSPLTAPVFQDIVSGKLRL